MIGAAAARGSIRLNRPVASDDEESDHDYLDHTDHKHPFKVFFHTIRRKTDDPKFIKLKIRGN